VSSSAAHKERLTRNQHAQIPERPVLAEHGIKLDFRDQLLCARYETFTVGRRAGAVDPLRKFVRATGMSAEQQLRMKGFTSRRQDPTLC